MDPISTARSILNLIGAIYSIYETVDTAENSLRNLCTSVNNISQPINALLQQPGNLTNSAASLTSILELLYTIRSFIELRTRKTLMGNIMFVVLVNDTASQVDNFQMLLNHCLTQLSVCMLIDFNEHLRVEFQALREDIRNIRAEQNTPNESREPMDGMDWFTYLLSLLPADSLFRQMSSLWQQNDGNAKARTFRDFKNQHPACTLILAEELQETFARADHREVDDYYPPGGQVDMVPHTFSYFNTGYEACLGDFFRWLSAHPPLNTRDVSRDVIHVFANCVYKSTHGWYRVFRPNRSIKPFKRHYSSVDGLSMTHVDMRCESTMISGILANMSESAVSITFRHKRFRDLEHMILWSSKQELKIPQQL